jgi:hypothetical protein
MTPLSSFGVWLAVLTDSINIKHYFAFTGHNLPNWYELFGRQLRILNYITKIYPLGRTIYFSNDSREINLEVFF